MYTRCCQDAWSSQPSRVTTATFRHGATCKIQRGCSGSVARRQHSLYAAQAAAFPRLCTLLWIADGLRELVLHLRGRAAQAVTEKIAELGRLTQLDSLQVSGVYIAVYSGDLHAALNPLTRLTELGLQFNEDHLDVAGLCPAPQWGSAVSNLINLQELRVASAPIWFGTCGFFRGALPASLSRLTALRRLEVHGQRDWDALDESDQLQLGALPALETAALWLYTQSGQYPGLGRQQEVVLSRMVSLSLSLQVDVLKKGSGTYVCVHEPFADTYLPALIAPALTELILCNFKLAPDSEPLGWLPGLPRLRRLVLTDVKLSSRQLPRGIAACSGLTELVVTRLRLDYKPDVLVDNRVVRAPDVRLSALPAVGPYVSSLVRVSLTGNAFAVVPPVLAAATALQHLDLSHQMLRNSKLIIEDRYLEQQPAPVQGLHVLDNLTRLESVTLLGYKKAGAGIRRFRLANPSVSAVLDTDDDDDDDSHETGTNDMPATGNCVLC